MKYASENDWPALSSVVRPPVIFLLSSDTRIWARATMAGSTPARSRRARSASRPSVSRNSPMSSSDETLEARYSATPVSVSESDRTRSEEHTSELQSLAYLVCRLLLEKKKKRNSLLRFAHAHTMRN